MDEKQLGAVGAPRPERAESLRELIDTLGLLRAWAGNPSYRVLAKKAGALLGTSVPHSTVADVFSSRRRRLDLDLFLAIVRALGAADQDVAAWRRAFATAHAATAGAQGTRSGPVRVLRQLPADLVTFTGRADEVSELLKFSLGGDGRVAVIAAIEGMAGIGKTRLAVHVAHLLIADGQFADGQLYANLRGFDPVRPPAESAAVTDDFLRELGIPGSRIPVDPQARAAMFRDRLQGKRMLLLLDDVTGPEQVADLLPANPECLVLITSRRSLTGLDGAHLIQLSTFSSAEAVELLARIAGRDRVDADPDAAAAVAAARGCRRCLRTPAAGAGAGGAAAAGTARLDGGPPARPAPGRAARRPRHSNSTMTPRHTSGGPVRSTGRSVRGWGKRRSW